MIHWFKRHPQYLVEECKALDSDTNYKQVSLLRKNLLISQGEILVRTDKTHRFPILIVYPEATPYLLPDIYPLTRLLSEAELDWVASGTSVDVRKHISQLIKVYHQYRHQNESGNLCILEWDSLDNEVQFYGISSVISRVKDWCRGTLTGKFPKDSAEVEFHAHFWKHTHDLNLVYPDSFLVPGVIDGEAYGLLLSKVSKGTFNEIERTTYQGCALTGKTSAGIVESVDADLPNFFAGQGIQNALDLIEKRDQLEFLVNAGKIIHFPWFHIDSEPAPFRSMAELVSLIGRGDTDNGLNRLASYLTREQKELPNRFLLALRFPNRKGTMEFQLFRINKVQEFRGGIIGTPLQKISYFLDSYHDVEAVPCELFSEQVHHLRNASRADRSILKEKAIGVLGVGALGGEISDCLGKAGVGKMLLLDNQTVRMGNPIRHLAGFDHHSVSKALAVAKIIIDHNPFVDLLPIPANINHLDFNDVPFEVAAYISSIAEDNTEGYINERAVINNKNVYYVRALRGGKAARIFRVLPEKDPCFYCLQLFRQQGREVVEVPEDKELITLRNECNNPIRPASAADLKLIASLTSRIILDELQQGMGAYNHWIWSTESIGALQPYQLHRQTIEKHPQCYYCNHEKKVNVSLADTVLSEMRSLIAENTAIETGGVLAGYRDGMGNLMITHASGPGPKAIKEPTKFEKDVEFCQAFLDKLFADSAGKIVYIGEWHNHPNLNNKPSGTDLKSLSSIAFQKEYLTDTPAMIIFTNTGQPSCTIHPAGKRYYFVDLQIVK